MQLIRMGDFVGVRYDIKSANDKFEIYNVVKDPKEKNNLAGQNGFEKLQANMKAKVLQIRISDPDASRPYDDTPVPGIDLSKNAKKGIKWSFFKGNFQFIPSLNAPSADQSGITKSPIPIKTAKGMIMYKTFIKIPKRGVYTFKLHSDHNAFVKLHEFNLLDADFNYKTGEVVQRAVTLDEGYHPLTIYYLKDPDIKGGFKLQFKAESGIWEDLGEKNCFY